MTFSGRGFTPGEQITITVSSGTAGGGAGGGGVGRSVPRVIPAANQTISTTADAAGAFSVDVVLADPGAYTLTAVDATSGITQTSTVTVAAAQPASVTPASLPDLASTGAGGELLIWGLVGAGAIAAGAGSVVVARRRSTHPARRSFAPGNGRGRTRTVPANRRF